MGFVAQITKKANVTAFLDTQFNLALSLGSVSFKFRLQVYKELGKGLTYQASHTGCSGVCGSLLHWQCRTIPGLLYSLTEAVKSKSPAKGAGTSASLYYIYIIYQDYIIHLATH